MTGTEKKIMDAALKLFSEHGLKGTTIRDIAKIADVNPSAINYHFGSKENLYKDVIGEMGQVKLQATLNTLGDDVDAKNQNEFAQKLRIFTDELVKAFQDEPEVYNLILGEMNQGLPYAKEEFETLLPELVDRITKFIANGKKKGYVKKSVEPQLASFIFIGMLFYPYNYKELLKEFDLIDLEDKKNRSKYVKLSLNIFVDGILN